MILRTIKKPDSCYWVTTDIGKHTGIEGIGNTWHESLDCFVEKLKAAGINEKITGHLCGDFPVKDFRESTKQTDFEPNVIPIKGRIPNRMIHGDYVDISKPPKMRDV